MEIINTMECYNCKNKIHYDAMEYAKFTEFIDKTFGRQSFFNMLTFADKHVKCCEHPDYGYPELRLKIKEVAEVKQ